MIRHRRLLITDERYGPGVAQLLAWNVIVRGTANRAQYLVRASDGRFLLHTISTQPVLIESVDVLIHEQASECYASMPVRLGAFDATARGDPDSSN